MDVVCPSLPLNVLTPEVTDAKLRPLARHTPRMAADGCHFAVRSLYVLLVIIKVSSSLCAIMSSRELSCIRQEHRSCQALCQQNNHALVASITRLLVKLPAQSNKFS